MADVDTIVVLDNLQFEHLNTANIFTINADGEAGEAVVTKIIMLPMNASAARVLVSNNGATGSAVYVRVKGTAVTGITTTTVTKTQNTELLAWQSLVLNAVILESTEFSLANVYDAMVHVDVAIAGTTAHLGTEIIVEVRKEATVDEWTVWQRLSVLSGKTAFSTDVASTAAAAQKVIAIANPTAGNLDHINKRLFIEDATAANCEIVWQTECGADA